MKIELLSAGAGVRGKQAFTLVELCIGMLLSVMLIGMLALVCAGVQLESKNITTVANGFANDGDWLEFVENISPYRLHEDGSLLCVASGAETQCLGWYQLEAVPQPARVVYRILLLRPLLPQELQRYDCGRQEPAWGAWLLVIKAEELAELLQRDFLVQDLVALLAQDGSLAADSQLMHVFASPPRLHKQQDNWQLSWQNALQQQFSVRVGGLFLRSLPVVSVTPER